ncbi:MAG: tRNA lysidine(34) synthetase TilS [Schleiferiaceae bacterium]
MNPWNNVSPAFAAAVSSELFRLLGPPDAPVVALVSGGMDSMMLAEALRANGYPLHVLHVNYGLRGAESQGDQAFVADWAQRSGTPVRVVTAPTDFGQAPDLQARARHLRYGAAHEWADELGSDHLVTAHHADDAIETFLLFAARGTGIDGLVSLAPSQGRLRRPFLDWHKTTLAAEAVRCGIAWREDASNEGDKYTRNHLRHHAVPALEQAIPQAREGVSTTIRRLRQLQKFAEVAVQRESSLYTAMSRRLPGARVLYRDALAHPHSEVIVHQILKPYAPFELEALRQLAESQVGAHLERDGWRIWADREGLLLCPVADRPFDATSDRAQLEIPLWDGHVWHPRAEISRTELRRRPSDLGSATAPVTVPIPEGALWRRWTEGDSIHPIGLKGRKKVSDALTEAKVPSPVRREVVVLAASADPGEVLWIPGIRLSQSLAVASDAARVLRWTVNYL